MFAPVITTTGIDESAVDDDDDDDVDDARVIVIFRAALRAPPRAPAPGAHRTDARIACARIVRVFVVVVVVRRAGRARSRERVCVSTRARASDVAIAMPPTHHALACSLATGDGSAQAILAARFSHDAKHVVACGRDRAFALYNASSGALIKTYAGGHAHEVRDVACAPTGATIASCGGDRGVFLWDVATGAAVRKWSGHEGRGGANAVRFAGASASVVASAGDDASVRVWDVRSRDANAVQVLNSRTGVAFGDAVTSLAVDDGGGARVSCASVDGAVRTIDLRRGTCDVDVIGAPVTCVRLSGDNRCALVGCLTSRVGLIDVESGDTLATYRGHVAETAKTECCLTNDDAYVIAGSEDGRVCIWDLVSARLVSEIQAHRVGSAVCGVDYSRRGASPKLVTTGADGRAHVWVPV